VALRGAGSDAHTRCRIRNGPASRNEGHEDLHLARRCPRRDGAAQVSLPHARSPAAASHSSRPSIRRMLWAVVARPTPLGRATCSGTRATLCRPSVSPRKGVGGGLDPRDGLDGPSRRATVAPPARCDARVEYPSTSLLALELDDELLVRLAAQELAAGHGERGGQRLAAPEHPVAAEDLGAPRLGRAVAREALDEPVAIDEDPSDDLGHPRRGRESSSRRCRSAVGLIDGLEWPSRSGRRCT